MSSFLLLGLFVLVVYYQSSNFCIEMCISLSHSVFRLCCEAIHVKFLFCRPSHEFGLFVMFMSVFKFFVFFLESLVFWVI